MLAEGPPVLRAVAVALANALLDPTSIAFLIGGCFSREPRSSHGAWIRGRSLQRRVDELEEQTLTLAGMLRDAIAICDEAVRQLVS